MEQTGFHCCLHWVIHKLSKLNFRFYNLLGYPSAGAIRTIRLLRPLRSINKIKGIRIIVASIIDSIPPLGNVLVFLGFIIILFATFGLHLFAGMYEYRCRLTPKPVGNTWELLPDYNQLCNPDRNNCPAGSFCGAPITENIPWDEEEINIPYFNYGITGFDDIGHSVLSIS